MNETIASIIEKVVVRYSVPTLVHGGHKSTEFFDCARLSPSDLARLAAHATGDLEEEAFDAVVGIAYTGIFFAAAVAGGKQVNILQKDGQMYGPELKGRKVIVVGDVAVTGEHLAAAAAKVAAVGAEVVGYACIVDRSGGKAITTGLPLWSAHQAPLE
jgi:orotate phosphoribosyltransferase